MTDLKKYNIHEAINMRALENNSALEIDFKFTAHYCEIWQGPYDREEPPVEWDIAGRIAELRMCSKKEWKEAYSKFRAIPTEMSYCGYNNLKPDTKISDVIDLSESAVPLHMLGGDGMAVVYGCM